MLSLSQLSLTLEPLCVPLVCVKPSLLRRVRGGTEAAKGAWDKARVWVFIGLWYYFNVYFNISNKKVTHTLEPLNR